MKKSFVLAATVLALSSVVAMASDGRAPAKAQHVARAEKAKALYDYVPAGQTQTQMPMIYGIAY